MNTATHLFPFYFFTLIHTDSCKTLSLILIMVTGWDETLKPLSCTWSRPLQIKVGQCLFYKYKQSQIMNSPKQILKSIFPRWNLWVNAWGWLGLSSSKQAVSGVWACKNTCSCTSLPSTGGSDPIFCCYCWRSGKKAGERERRKRKCQKKHTIMFKTAEM